MSRTVLFSEVNEVAARFPDCIAEIRPTLLYSELVKSGRPMLPALAERLVSDAAFRGDLQAAVLAAWDREPQISYLEMLGALVIAAVGLEQAAVSATDAAADLSKRTLFNFVLDCGRRRREIAAGARESTTEPLRQVAADATGTRLESPETISRLGRERTRAASQASEAVAANRSASDTGWPVRAVPPAAEVPEAPPRRWGMWTAATCGVLLGFGLGALAHVDHTVAPANARSAVATGVPQANAAPQDGVKSIEQLRAEIAALDSVADLSRSGNGDPGTGRHGIAVRSDARSQRVPRDGAAYADVPALGAREQGSRPAARSGGSKPPEVASSAGPAAAFAAPASKLPTPFTAAVRPVNMTGGNVSEGSLSHAMARASVPHVVAGAAGIMAANLMSSPAPAYPPAATAAGVQGEVIVEAVVGRDGGVVETRVVSGPPSLRAAALDAVQRWQYRPFEVDGKPVEVATTAVLEFRLDR